MSGPEADISKAFQELHSSPLTNAEIDALFEKLELKTLPAAIDSLEHKRGQLEQMRRTLHMMTSQGDSAISGERMISLQESINSAAREIKLEEQGLEEKYVDFQDTLYRAVDSVQEYKESLRQLWEAGNIVGYQQEHERMIHEHETIEHVFESIPELFRGSVTELLLKEEFSRLLSEDDERMESIATAERAKEVFGGSKEYGKGVITEKDLEGILSEVIDESQQYDTAVTPLLERAQALKDLALQPSAIEKINEIIKQGEALQEDLFAIDVKVLHMRHVVSQSVPRATLARLLMDVGNRVAQLRASKQPQLSDGSITLPPGARSVVRPDVQPSQAPAQEEGELVEVDPIQDDETFELVEAEPLKEEMELVEVEPLKEEMELVEAEPLKEEMELVEVDDAGATMPGMKPLSPDATVSLHADTMRSKLESIRVYHLAIDDAHKKLDGLQRIVESGQANDTDSRNQLKKRMTLLLQSLANADAAANDAGVSKDMRDDREALAEQLRSFMSAVWEAPRIVRTASDLAGARGVHQQVRAMYASVQHTLSVDQRRALRGRIAMLSSVVRQAERDAYRARFSHPVRPRTWIDQQETLHSTARLAMQRAVEYANAIARDLPLQFRVHQLPDDIRQQATLASAPDTKASQPRTGIFSLLGNAFKLK